MAALATPTRHTFIASGWKEIDKGSLTGSFDILLPSGMIIHGMMLFSKNGKRWCGFPSREYSNADGERRFLPFIDFSSAEARNRFLDSAREAIGTLLGHGDWD